MATETNSRSLLKAISYRLLSSVITGSIVFGVTRQGRFAIIAALFDSLIKTLFYYLHERVWTAIDYGRVQNNTEEIEVQKSLIDSDLHEFPNVLSEPGLSEGV